MSNRSPTTGPSRRGNEARDTDLWTCFDDLEDQKSLPTQQSKTTNMNTSTEAPLAASPRKILVPKAPSVALRDMNTDIRALHTGNPNAVTNPKMSINAQTQRRLVLESMSKLLGGISARHDVLRKDVAAVERLVEAAARPDGGEGSRNLMKLFLQMKTEQLNMDLAANQLRCAALAAITTAERAPQRLRDFEVTAKPSRAINAGEGSSVRPHSDISEANLNNVSSE
jgi:hypothetical protein